MTDVLDLHPTYRNSRFTLRGLFTSEAKANQKLKGLLAAGLRPMLLEDASPSGHPVFLVAAQHDVDVKSRAALPHYKDVPWRAAAFSIDLFRRILRSSYGRPVRRWYKALEPEKIRATYQRMDWSGSNLDVAARIITNLILAHPFPNANHRTSIDLGRLYLLSVGIAWPAYELRGRGRNRFFRETKPFYLESKYLLQLVRHAPLLRAANRVGYRRIRFASDTVREIHKPDLDLSDGQVRRRHWAAAKRMIRSLAAEADHAALDAARGRGLREWVDWVEGRSR